MIPFLAEYFKVWFDEDGMKEFNCKWFLYGYIPKIKKFYQSKCDCTKHRGLLQTKLLFNE